jgi:hypothetical protein
MARTLAGSGTGVKFRNMLFPDVTRLIAAPPPNAENVGAVLKSKVTPPKMGGPAVSITNQLYD